MNRSSYSPAVSNDLAHFSSKITQNMFSILISLVKIGPEPEELICKNLQIGENMAERRIINYLFASLGYKLLQNSQLQVKAQSCDPATAALWTL
ncbi:hypothetical protein VNO77_08061 [Canavalia gladiata]|uniref:Uncharacterized protein n=1 Tax=Canavalia gladiata TaxID=3824 RepID=A0AAN9QW29_CANGL